MVADTHVKGTLYLLAGHSIRDYRIIAALDSEVADHAAGAEPYYFVPGGAQVGLVSLPRNDGIPYDLPLGPHVLPGELLMLAVETNDANTATDVDTTGAASDVYQFTYWEFNQRTGESYPRVVTDETNRNTTTGVAPPTDPKVVKGVIIPTHAWGPVAPAVDWTIIGRAKFDLRSAA